MDIKKIEAVIKLMGQYGLHEIEVEEGNSKIKVVQNSQMTVPTMGHMMPSMMQPMAAQQAAYPVAKAEAPVVATSETPVATKRKGREIKSPFVGTFYRSPSPGSDSFVEIGKRVRKGDTLCIIEAMKLMNEIEADADGVIVDILVDNESPVEYDQPLFIIE